MTKRGFFISSIAATLLAALLPGCGRNDFHVRYRLAFSVKANGEVKSASSVIDVLYYGVSSSASKIDGHYSYSMYKGVAPVIDLGPHGMLAAAMSPVYTEYYRRKKEYGLTCKVPQDATAFPTVVGPGDYLKAFAKSQTGEKIELPDKLYPAFIWFPAGASYKQAQQICPEEFAKVIGAPIALQSITIESAPDAPLVELFGIKAPWLDEIRIDQRDGVIGDPNIFKPRRYSQLETGKVAP